MDRLSFIQLAYFLGSDYTIGVKHVGIVHAVEILSEFKSDDANSDLEDDVSKCLAPLLRFRDWFNDKKSLRAKTLRKRLGRVKLEDGFPDPSIARAYLEPEVDHSHEMLVWGKPDWNVLRDFALSKLHWSAEKVDSLLTPIELRLEELEVQGKISTQTSLLQFFDSLPKGLVLIIVLLLFIFFFDMKEIPLNVNSKRLDHALSVYKGDEQRPFTQLKKKRRKKARSAYSFFVNASSEAWKEENPDKSFADFSRFCAAEWKALKDKSKFNKLAKEDRKRAEREREEEEEQEEELDDDDEVKEEDDDKVVILEEDGEERPVSSGPPFSRRALEREKMPRLRLLCFT